MPASEYNFSIDQGSSFTLALISKDSDGNIIDLTGYCARLVMTTNRDQTYIFETENMDYSKYKFSVDGSSGRITLFIPASATNSYNFDNAKYDYELQSPNEHYFGGGKFTERILYGIISLNKRYSKTSTLLDCAS